MYSQWVNITERDLIQKGNSYNVIKNLLTLDKLVLNMTLPNTIDTTIGVSSTKSGLGTNESGKTKKVESTTNSIGTGGISFGVSVMSLLAVVSGQRPILTKARKSIANWKVRKNQVLGFKVTLRGKSILEFLDKTIRFNATGVTTPSGVNLSSSPTFKDPFLAKNQLGLSAVSSVSDIINKQSSLSIGIKNINIYPELEDLWLVQNLNQKSGSNLGFDLSLTFKKATELSFLRKLILGVTVKSNKLHDQVVPTLSSPYSISKLRTPNLGHDYLKSILQVWSRRSALLNTLHVPSRVNKKSSISAKCAKLFVEGGTSNQIEAVMIFQVLLSLRKIYLTSLGLYF